MVDKIHMYELNLSNSEIHDIWQVLIQVIILQLLIYYIESLYF